MKFDYQTMTLIKPKINNIEYINDTLPNSKYEMSLFKKNHRTLLMKKDDLYETIISKLPIQNRKNYCESLIFRTQQDLTNPECQIQKKELKKLLKAAEIELKNLDNILNH
ncbi:hypothetical protein [uncultured Aquimarina sp.]|uniref:hypothetical protein n=1 Tax=uncultured Aquimarina sp. TaxID=575652 RepID=UPI00261D5FAA|nr:hypothetical protein [uncultured Aquimarina sp.]